MKSQSQRWRKIDHLLICQALYPAIFFGLSFKTSFSQRNVCREHMCVLDSLTGHRRECVDLEHWDSAEVQRAVKNASCRPILNPASFCVDVLNVGLQADHKYSSHVLTQHCKPQPLTSPGLREGGWAPSEGEKDTSTGGCAVKLLGNRKGSCDYNTFCLSRQVCCDLVEKINMVKIPGVGFTENTRVITVSVHFWIPVHKKSNKNGIH